MNNNSAKQLLIFPGSGDPAYPLYARVYELIASLASKAGYDDVDCSIRWPGQKSFNRPGVLNVHSAVAVAKDHLRNADEAGGDYVVLARSFGCFVALQATTEYRPRNCRRLVLWGPPPYWKLHDLLVSQIEDQIRKSRDKHVIIDGSYFSSFTPVEQLLRDAVIETVVAYGTKDRLAPKHLVSVIEEIAAENQLVKSPRSVIGADHEVTGDEPPEVIAAYFDALFKN